MRSTLRQGSYAMTQTIYLSEKRHIIKSEPIIQPGNERYVHHFIVSICTSAIPAEDLAHTGPCYDKANMPSSLYNCNSGFGDMLPAWAVGGGEYNLPDNVGFPVGPGDVFIVVETHFDNPEMHTIWDSSGMRYYHTGNLRPLEGGSMFVGLTVDNLFQIPPRQQAFQADAWCTADCTNQLPQDGLHLFGATLHTHVAGRSVKLRLIDSEGQEQKPILYEPFYDFNYQDNTVIDRMLHRGDVLKLECVYNTMDRSEPTLGGQSTAEEMCLAYLFYWPKIDWGGCLSMDYTKTVSSQRGKVQYCGRSEFTYAELTNYTEYTAPPCNRVAPDANALVPLLAQGPLDFSSYPSGRYLDKEQKFKMYWRINRNTLSIDIGLEVETAGWVSLGISPMGMINADMVVAWVRDGVAYFDDRLATAQAMPRTDLELGGTEDIYRITGSEYTVLPPAKSNKLSQENKIVLGSGVAILVGFLFFFFWLRWRAKRLRSIETNPLIGSPNKGKAAQQAKPRILDYLLTSSSDSDKRAIHIYLIKVPECRCTRAWYSTFSRSLRPAPVSE
eukprot:g1770.t1